MKEIQLSKSGKNKGKYVTLVDDEDFEALNQFRWCVKQKATTFYAMRKNTVGGKQESIMMHCIIMGGKGVDHKDHNGLNNQKDNLRLCTNSENAMNRRKQRGCVSAYKGVSFYRRTGKWQAYIRIDDKSIYLGYFISEMAAAKAYNTKAAELFGEFANLNKLDT